MGHLLNSSLFNVDHHKQQEVEDVEQLRDKRSYDSGKSTTTASQELDGNDQCLTIIKKLKNKYREVFEVGTELKPMKGRPVVLEVKDNVKVNPIHVCTPRKTAYALVGSVLLRGCPDFLLREIEKALLRGSPEGVINDRSL